MAPSDAPGGGERFEAVDWSRYDSGPETDHTQLWLPTLGLLAVSAAFGYDYLTAGLPLIDPHALDWLLVAALSVLSPLVAVPLVRRPARLRRYWEALRDDRLALGGFVFIVAFALVGLFGPLYFHEPPVRILYAAQPPVWGSIDANYVPACYGPVVDGRCQGTWRYPLGTSDIFGRDLLPMLVLGTRTALSVVVGSAAIIVPTGLAVGLTAVTVGGRVEEGLLWVSELLQTFPAVLVYFLLFWWLVEGRLLLLVVVLGLVGWGGIARLVRNEALERQNELYVAAAECCGADRRRIVRRHLLPNIAPAVITAVTLQLPLFVLVEASVSFVQISVSGGTTTLGDPSHVSWGQLVFLGIVDSVQPASWWVGGFPVVLLVGTVLSFNLVGNALTEGLDPRR